MDRIEPKTLLEGSWKFDESVAEVFTDMLSRSIPGYDNMRELMFRMARNFLRPHTNVLDIGCSTGLSSKELVECEEAKMCDFTLIDVSEPMLQRCQKLYQKDRRVDVRKWDIREGCPVQRCSVVLSCLTLQFVPMEYRQNVISSIYNSLQREGALFLVEKVIGNSSVIDDVMVKEYYNIKKDNAFCVQSLYNTKE
jgi:tRNA (cmo5U34)-methyltransferase